MMLLIPSLSAGPAAAQAPEGSLLTDSDTVREPTNVTVDSAVNVVVTPLYSPNRNRKFDPQRELLSE